MAAKQQLAQASQPSKEVRAKFSEEDWVSYVTVGLKMSQAAILDAGLRIWQFRQECEGINSDQDFFKKAKEFWGFSDTASSMWSKIGSNYERLQPVADHLPPSYRSIYELTQLNEDRFDQAIKNTEINPSLTQQQVKTLKQPVLTVEEKKQAEAKAAAEKRKQHQQEAADAKAKADRAKQNLENPEPTAADDIAKHVGLAITGDSDALAVLGIDSYFPRAETIEVVLKHYRASRRDNKEIQGLLDKVEEHLNSKK